MLYQSQLKYIAHTFSMDFYCYDYITYQHFIKIMEINKPDLGVFKNFAKLETNKNINRKIFPKVRNQHQFQYTHGHQNDYKTAFGAFKQFDKKQYNYTRMKGNGNKSNFQLGTDLNIDKNSENKRNFRKYDFSMPPKPFKQPQEGVGINDYEKLTGEKIDTYFTTVKQSFNILDKNRKSDYTVYKYARSQKFNPITGEYKGSKTNFGFQDYGPNNKTKYKANNHTMIPLRNQKYDIITGRKLTHC